MQNFLENFVRNRSGWVRTGVICCILPFCGLMQAFQDRETEPNTAPYMHDGRFSTIEQVLDHYSEHIQQARHSVHFLQNSSNQSGGTKLALTPNEKNDLISFLGMLTDSAFISNPEFSNPTINR